MQTQTQQPHAPIITPDTALSIRDMLELQAWLRPPLLGGPTVDVVVHEGRTALLQWWPATGKTEALPVQ